MQTQNLFFSGPITKCLEFNDPTRATGSNIEPSGHTLRALARNAACAEGIGARWALDDDDDDVDGFDYSRGVVRREFTCLLQVPAAVSAHRVHSMDNKSKLSPPGVSLGNGGDSSGDILVKIGNHADMQNPTVTKADEKATLQSKSRKRKLQPVSPRPAGALDTVAIEKAAKLIRKSRRVLVLTGAGISVSSGVSDFRSRGGVYDRIESLGLDVPQPECVFDIDFFRDDPGPFYKAVRLLFPPGASAEPAPSASHRFLRALDARRKLLRNYTQNVDGLELVAGVSPRRVLQCHGSMATATCLRCRARYTRADMRPFYASGRVFLCRRVRRGVECAGVVKPDVVFFGEPVNPRMAELLEKDRGKADLLVVIGTSLSVTPVSEIVEFLPSVVPQILVNRNKIKPKIRKTRRRGRGEPAWSGFDLELLGDCDAVVTALQAALGWKDDGVEARATQKH